MLQEGQTVGPYELVRRLGGGAFGEVWLARHIDLGVERAMKIPTDPDYVRQLRQEGQIQFHVHHSNIVQTVDLNTVHTPPYFVMEYVDGRDLRKHLTERGRLPVAEAIHILSQILDALQAAHAANVIHRDLKPENILITPDGTVKITDFGLGKVKADVSRSLLVSGSLMKSEAESVSGTYAYMSPEQQEGKEPDPRDDIYAAGVIGCELLTGTRPSGAGALKTLRRAGIDAGLAAIIEKALDLPDDRFRSAGEMLARLKGSPPPPPPKYPRESPTISSDTLPPGPPPLPPQPPPAPTMPPPPPGIALRPFCDPMGIFSLSVPATWQVQQQQPGAFGAVHPTQRANVVVTSGPRVMPNLQLFAQALIATWQMQVPGWTQLGWEMIQLTGGRPALHIRATGMPLGMVMLADYFLVLSDAWQACLMVSCFAGELPQWQGLFRQIVASWQVA